MNTQTKQNKPFNQILLQAIDDVLGAIGSSTKSRIYFLLKKQKGITKEQIPERIEEFHQTLESIFGTAVTVIERYLIQALETRVKVRCPIELKGKTIGDCLIFLRQEYEESQFHQ